MQNVEAPPVKPLVVRPDDACRLLSISLDTLRRMVKKGELKVIKIGRDRRFSLAEIEAIAAGGAATHD